MYTQDKVSSFCTISDQNYHGPASIFAHLRPVLDWLQTRVSQVSSVHFMSDGRTSEYRSKQNFYLYNSMMREQNIFIRSTWKFTEAGHCKGAAELLKNILIFYIEPTEIEEKRKSIPDNLLTVKGTIKTSSDLYG